nr:MAG TPA: hypothetical protein [Caudoviricetes sp.]
MPGNRLHGIMPGVLQSPPVQGTGTAETRRYPATRLHWRGCRAGTRPKQPNPTTKGTLTMDLLGIFLVAWFIWMICDMWKR